jgi:hypothetical protein
VPHLESATRFVHAVAPALNKWLRGSLNVADAVAKRNIPRTRTLVFLLATLYVRCDVECVEQLQDRSPWQVLWRRWVQAVSGLHNKQRGLAYVAPRWSTLSRNIVLILILRDMFLPYSILLRNILFCFLVRTRQHVEWYWCCLCGNWCSPVFNDRKELPLDQRVVQRKTTIHTRKSHERWNVEWAKRLHKNVTFRGPCIVIYSYNKTNVMY